MDVFYFLPNSKLYAPPLALCGGSFQKAVNCRLYILSFQFV